MSASSASLPYWSNRQAALDAVLSGVTPSNLGTGTREPQPSTEMIREILP